MSSTSLCQTSAVAKIGGVWGEHEWREARILWSHYSSDQHAHAEWQSRLLWSASQGINRTQEGGVHRDTSLGQNREAINMSLTLSLELTTEQMDLKPLEPIFMNLPQASAGNDSEIGYLISQSLLMLIWHLPRKQFYC